MKKIAIISFACTAALLTLASCDQSLLDIPQKGVVAYESFYKTDEDAESALVSAYANVVKMYGKLTSNTPSYNRKSMSSVPRSKLRTGIWPRCTTLSTRSSTSPAS